MTKKRCSLFAVWMIALPAVSQELRISADRRAIDFGEVQVGSTYAVGLDVVNRGNEPLTLTCSGGAVPGPFSQSNSCFGATLSTDEACSVEYTFAPTSLGVFDSQADLVCNGLPITVDIRARSKPVRLETRISRIDFGQVTVNNPTPSRFSVSINNFGSSRVDMQCDNEVIDHPAFNVILSTCNGASIAPLSACSYQIGFLPTVSGPASGTFAPNCLGISLPVQLDGEGVVGPPTQSLYVPIRDLNFGSLVVNEPSPAILGARVTNLGPPQTVICTGGGVDSPFANSNECNNVSLGTGQQCFLTFNALSAVPGQFSETSTYTCNGNVYSIDLTANVEQPTLRFNATALQFDAVAPDRPFVSTQVELVNQSNNVLTLDCTTPTEQLPFASSNFCNGVGLFPGQSCTFTYAFFPFDLGDFSDTSTLTCNGVPLELELRATAVPAPPLFSDSFEPVPMLP